MKLIGGVIGLLLVVALVGWLARTQLSASTAPVRPPVGVDTGGAPAVPLNQQPRQLQQSVEGLMQTPRVPQDETK
jgi:hypothetical protein